MTVIRAAITQTTWTGDGVHARQARAVRARRQEQGAQVICFQELFYGPYFGITEDAKYYAYAEPADGPVVQRFAALAANSPGAWCCRSTRRSNRASITTPRRRRRGRHILGKYRKTPHPATSTSSGRSSTSARKPRYPVFHTAVGPIGVYICYDRHFPEGWRELGLDGAQIVFNPNATKPGLSNRLWEFEQPAAAAANGYSAAAPTASALRTTSTATWRSRSTAPASS